MAARVDWAWKGLLGLHLLLFQLILGWCAMAPGAMGSDPTPKASIKFDSVKLVYTDKLSKQVKTSV